MIPQGSGRKTKSVDSSIGTYIEDLFEDIADAVSGNRRKDLMRQFADDYHFSFKKRIHFRNLDLNVQLLPLFQVTKSRRVRNVLTKLNSTQGTIIKIFDLYQSQTQRDRYTTCLLIDDDEFFFPHFQLRPKSGVDKLKNIFMYSRSTLDDYPIFKKTHILRTEHPESLHHYLTPALHDMITKEGIVLEGHQQYLLMYKTDKAIGVEELNEFTELGMSISDNILHDHTNELV